MITQRKIIKADGLTFECESDAEVGDLIAVYSDGIKKHNLHEHTCCLLLEL